MQRTDRLHLPRTQNPSTWTASRFTLPSIPTSYERRSWLHLDGGPSEKPFDEVQRRTEVTGTQNKAWTAATDATAAADVTDAADATAAAAVTVGGAAHGRADTHEQQQQRRQLCRGGSAWGGRGCSWGRSGGGRRRPVFAPLRPRVGVDRGCGGRGGGLAQCPRQGQWSTWHAAGGRSGCDADRLAMFAAGEAHRRGAPSAAAQWVERSAGEAPRRHAAGCTVAAATAAGAGHSSVWGSTTQQSRRPGPSLSYLSSRTRATVVTAGHVPRQLRVASSFGWRRYSLGTSATATTDYGNGRKWRASEH